MDITASDNKYSVSWQLINANHEGVGGGGTPRMTPGAERSEVDLDATPLAVLSSQDFS